VEYSSGATSASELKGVSTTAQPGYVAGAPVANSGYDVSGVFIDADRITLSTFDGQGHATQTKDASGVNRFFSYNKRGQLAKTWQTVRNTAGQPMTTLYEAYEYDKVGRLTSTLGPYGNLLTTSDIEY